MRVEGRKEELEMRKRSRMLSHTADRAIAADDDGSHWEKSARFAKEGKLSHRKERKIDVVCFHWLAGWLTDRKRKTLPIAAIVHA